jgi:isopenicillin N synthase-like dioxygenase
MTQSGVKSGVPTLSLAAYTNGDEDSREAFSKDLMRGLQRYGFFILKDHPVSVDLLEKAYELSAAFFAQPVETKRRYIGGQRGYTPFGVEHAKNTKAADLKEFWQIGPERKEAAGAQYGDIAPPNIWPDHPPGFKQTFIDLFNGLQHTGEIVLEALAPNLGLPKGYFAPLVADGNSVLRLLHYPPIPPDADPDCVRSAAHEDINFITLLVAAQGAGLELLDRDGTWLPVDADKNTLIVDSGDMLARMTNEVIPSTTHRVVNPKGPNVSRYSIPFFMHPNSDVSLKCLPSCVGDGVKYPEITAGAFLSQRLREIGLIKA